MNSKNEVVDSFECTICNEISVSQAALKGHMYRIHHEVAEQKRAQAEKEREARKLTLYDCVQCGHKCSTLAVRRRHMRGVHGEKGGLKVKCDECGLILYDKRGLEKHRGNTNCINRAQNSQGQMEEFYQEGTIHVKKDNGWRFGMGKSMTNCLFCATNFATNEEYSSHILLHQEGINWKCLFENCGRVMTKITTLKTHMKRHRNEFNHHCNACTKKFVTKKAHDLHMRVHRGEFKHTCEQCGHKFVSDWGYRKHVKKHSDPKIPCHLCGQMLSDKSSMRKHIEFIHEGKKRYTKEEMDIEVMCQICSKVFKGKMAPSTLQRHIKYVHMGGKHKVHNCEICGKGYQGKANLRQHVQVIHDQVYFFCDQCGAPFRSKTMLSSHIKIVHAATKGQFHECTECQTEFLKQYQKCSEHENVKICEKCGYTTSHGDQLKAHQGSKHCDPERTLKRKLWCNLCSRGFTREKALKKHELEHIRGKAHKCGACGQRFTERFNLNKHLKKGLCKKTMEVQRDI